MPKKFEQTKLLEKPESLAELEYDPVLLTAGDVEDGRQKLDDKRQSEIKKEFTSQKELELPEPDFENMAQASRKARDDQLVSGLTEEGLASPEAITLQTEASGSAAVRAEVQVSESAPEQVLVRR